MCRGPRHDRPGGADGGVRRVGCDTLAMKYLTFVANENVLKAVVGSSPQDVDQLERDLGIPIPAVLREYLLLMGETPLYAEYDHHGTREMKYLREWLGEWVERYRNEGIALREMENALPFDKFQDTFFYVPAQEGNDDPPVYAFDIHERPTIRKLHDRFSEFVAEKYEAKVNSHA